MREPCSQTSRITSDGPPRAERGDRRIGVAGAARLVAFVAQDAVDQQPDVGFVVDDQDVMRHPRTSHAGSDQRTADRRQGHRRGLVVQHQIVRRGLP